MIEGKIQKEFLNSIPGFRENSYVQNAISRVEKYLEERHPNVENPLKSNKKVDNEKNISEEKNEKELNIQMKPIPKKEKGGNEPMRNVNLEENELTITAIFQQHTKEETIQTLKEALEVLEQEESDTENDEMIEIINSTVGKLQQIEDKYYYSLDLNYYLNNLETMPMKLNQFAVYRVDQQTAGKALWHLPYQEARQQNVSITVENYRVISIHEMQEEEKSR